MEFAVAVRLNGELIVLAVFPTLEAAEAAAKASPFQGAFVASKR